jgi:hypothetical protein
MTLTALSAVAPGGRAQTISAIVARTGVGTDSPHEGTYRYLEFFQLHGPWIIPDLGALDFYHSNYRELFAGGGRTIYADSHVIWLGELFFAQAVGSAAHEARYLWPWTQLDVRIVPRLSGQVVYFTYIPLNNAAHLQHLLERAKLELAPGKAWKIGVGYAGYQYSGSHWQNRPFVTSTAKTRAGSFELWLQRMPDGGQLQLRYQLFWQ